MDDGRQISNTISSIDDFVSGAKNWGEIHQGSEEC